MATRKQKLAVKKLLENPSLTNAQIMREAGYSENSIIDPKKNLTSTKGFQELIAEYLPDDKVLAKHKSLLEATKIVTSPTEPDKEVPDNAIQIKAVDLAYRVKGQLNTNQLIQNNNFLVVRGEE